MRSLREGCDTLRDCGTAGGDWARAHFPPEPCAEINANAPFTLMWAHASAF